ncbi:MAG: DUF3810 domain-containing protein [Oscillospiraceae bacterium]|nr:DUF3810 domain-containing protein [Oscillospiraceae bacterium]
MTKLRSLFEGLMKRHIWIIGCAVFAVLFHLLTGNRLLMNALATGALWIKRLLAYVLSVLPISIMEWTIVAAVIGGVIYIIIAVRDIKRSEQRWRILYRRVSFVVALALTVYCAFCVLLSASYYADNFQRKSGLYAQKSSVEELYRAAEYFSVRLGEIYDEVERDENGVFCEDISEMFDDSTEIYEGVCEVYPFLGQESVKPKKMLFSWVMSYLNYTGIYFPLSGEANINVHQPSMMIPATIAHEMAHQRGVASEQEANFVEILTCMKSGNPVYEYSGAFSAFINLGNALYRYDKEAYAQLWYSLPPEVLADMQANNEYWQQFETKAAEVTEKVYDNFLKSQGQELGVQSYGACVDLLIAYYNEYGEF